MQIQRVRSQELKRIKQDEHVQKKAATPVYAMYELSIILEGFALDEGRWTVHELAVKLRSFLRGINDVQVVGDNSDVLEKILLRMSTKNVLIPILCEAIWMESRKFTQVFRQSEPTFIFGQEDTVVELFSWSKVLGVDPDMYKQVSKLLNELKRL